MQMACFYGRNASFIDEGHDAEQWIVEDFEAFKKTCIEKILDHGLPVPIFSAHLMKNFRAAGEEHEPASAQTKDWLLRAHNRLPRACSTATRRRPRVNRRPLSWRRPRLVWLT